MLPALELNTIFVPAPLIEGRLLGAASWAPFWRWLILVVAPLGFMSFKKMSDLALVSLATRLLAT